MVTKITKRIVDKLSPSGRDVRKWDAEVKGFGIRCRPSGAKFYVLKMRVGGRQRWFTIGRHGSPWTAETARCEALRLLGLRAAGKDPARDRDHEKGALIIAELTDRFLAEHVACRCKPRTAEDYRRAIGRYIRPVLGHHGLADLARADIVRLHHQLRHRPYQANRCLAVLSKMMNLAEAWVCGRTAAIRADTLKNIAKTSANDTSRRKNYTGSGRHLPKPSRRRLKVPSLSLP